MNTKIIQKSDFPKDLSLFSHQNIQEKFLEFLDAVAELRQSPIKEPSPEPFIGVKEASRLSALSVGTIYVKKHEGTLPFPVYKQGKKIFFKASEVIASFEVKKNKNQIQSEAESIADTYLMAGK